jgi:3,4-dihydroxy-9,10-secoandrosta-1,3,5(10)-triene-9,17-dione 4,5-dioxygenase
MSRINDDPDHVIVTLGEHTNDHMTSFYVTTPSGFQIEYGCNGLVVDDDTWQVAHYDAISTWGHKYIAADA